MSITKRALSSAMKELMAQCPMDKIKIGDIVERCGINRQSFYYHFKDKYDLVNWIFYTEFFEGVQNSFDKPIWGLMETMCDFFYENRSFYTNALQVRGQNSFSEYFTEVLHPILLSQNKEIFKDEQDSEFIATFYADAIRVAITRWLLEGAKVPPAEFVRLMISATTGAAFRIFMDLKKETE